MAAELVLGLNGIRQVLTPLESALRAKLSCFHVGAPVAVSRLGLTPPGIRRRPFECPLLDQVDLHRGDGGVFERHAGESPLRAFLHAVSFDALALLAGGGHAR